MQLSELAKFHHFLVRLHIKLKSLQASFFLIMRNDTMRMIIIAHGIAVKTK